MLRDAIAAGTALGRVAGPLMEKGGLVPDDLLNGIIERAAEPAGLRRAATSSTASRARCAQAEGFEKMGSGHTTSEFYVFNVEVPRDELLRRLSGRRWCPHCQSTYHVHNNPPKDDSLCDKDRTLLIQREDDKETAVARRLAEYDERTAPLIDYYRERARFHTVNGYRPPDAVFARADARSWRRSAS